MNIITEHFGYLKLTDEEYERAKITHPKLPQSAHVVLMYGVQSEGYWNTEKFIAQVKDAIVIAGEKISCRSVHISMAIRSEQWPHCL